MAATWIDHALVLCFAVLLPIRGATVGYRRLAALPADADTARVRFYRQSLLLHAAILLLTLGAWRAAGRDWQALGLAVPDGGRLLAGLAAVFAGLGLHYWQGAVALRRLEAQRRGIERLGRLDPLMPRTRRELDAFLVLLVVAAGSEEILFRGYLTAYLSSYLPLGVAATASVVAFGIGHLYQGAKGIAQTTIIGAVCMLLYLVTGSLWPGIVLHAGLNIVSAHIGHALVRTAPRAP
jgi:membrane protease YdiL (CAAX protease family)